MGIMASRRRPACSAVLDFLIQVMESVTRRRETGELPYFAAPGNPFYPTNPNLEHLYGIRVKTYRDVW